MADGDIRAAQAEFIRQYGATNEIIDVFTDNGELRVLLERPVDSLPAELHGVTVQTQVVGGHVQEE